VTPPKKEKAASSKKVEAPSSNKSTTAKSSKNILKKRGAPTTMDTFVAQFKLDSEAKKLEEIASANKRHGNSSITSFFRKNS